MYQGHSVVLTWDGLVTHHFKKYMKKLELKNRLLGYIQSVVLKRTCESILIDCRRGDDEMWMEEELSDIMERMETNPDGTRNRMSGRRAGLYFYLLFISFLVIFHSLIKCTVWL